MKFPAWEENEMSIEIGRGFTSMAERRRYKAIMNQKSTSELMAWKSNRLGQIEVIEEILKERKEENE